MYAPEIATVNSTFNWSMSSALNTSNLNITRVNVYSFAAAAAAKKLTGNAKKHADAERAITDTIQYLGWMSLKDGDHSGTGKDVAQAIERRAAADRLIAAGTIVLLGTWSNGIAVGPGAGFSAATNEVEVVAPVKKTRKPAATKPAPNHCPSIEDYIADPDSAPIALHGWHSEWCAPGTSCEWSADPYYMGTVCTWTPDAMHGPAFVAKPRVRVPLATMQACSPRWVAPTTMMSREECTRLVEAEFSIPKSEVDPAMHAEVVAEVEARWAIDSAAEERFNAAPAPIYAPSVGDTVAIRYQHERMTTDRVVTVQRVSPDGKAFRGYDRTYDRVRNYDMARVLTIRRLGGEGVEIAAG